MQEAKLLELMLASIHEAQDKALFNARDKLRDDFTKLFTELKPLEDMVRGMSKDMSYLSWLAASVLASLLAVSTSPGRLEALQRMALAIIDAVEVAAPAKQKYDA
jgi:hypothetical protein